jgi:hypothetical protein
MFLFFPHWEILLLGSEMQCSLSKELCEVECPAWFLYKSATSNGCPLCWCVYFCSSIAVLFQGRGQQLMKDSLQSIHEICTICLAATSIYEHLLCYRDVCWLRNFHHFMKKVATICITMIFYKLLTSVKSFFASTNYLWNFYNYFPILSPPSSLS